MIHFSPNNFTSGTQLDPVFVIVNQEMNWSDAQRYCRKNFIDLATVRNNTENQQIHNLMPSETLTWIGLFRQPDIYWSDGSGSSFRYWGDFRNPLGSLSVICGVAAVQSSGKWKLMSCERKLPFVCHSVPPSGKWFTVLQCKRTNAPHLNN